jgi:hypothetical protein
LVTDDSGAVVQALRQLLKLMLCCHDIYP